MKSTLVIAATLMSALLFGCVEVESGTSYEFTERIDNILVDVTNGNVQISSLPNRDYVGVEIEYECAGDVPSSHVRVQSGILHVLPLGEKPNRFCRTTVSIVAPSGITTDVRLVDGQVGVDDFVGALRIEAEVANVALASVGGDIQIQAALGSVIGYDIKGGATRIDLAKGEVNLVYGSAPNQVDTHVRDGQVVFAVPLGEYSILAHTNAGLADLEGLSHTPYAGSEINVSLETGNISIMASDIGSSELLSDVR